MCADGPAGISAFVARQYCEERALPRPQPSRLDGQGMPLALASSPAGNTRNQRRSVRSLTLPRTRKDVGNDECEAGGSGHRRRFGRGALS